MGNTRSAQQGKIRIFGQGILNAGQPVRIDKNIIVKIGQNFSPCQLRTEIPPNVKTRRRFINIANRERAYLGKAADYIPRSIGRAIINNNELDC